MYNNESIKNAQEPDTLKQGDELAEEFENLGRNAEHRVAAFFGVLYQEYFATINAEFATIDTMISNVVKRGIRISVNYKGALEAYLAAANNIHKMTEAHANKEYSKVLECLNNVCKNLKDVREYLKSA